MRNNLKAYRNVDRHSGLAAADPHTVIVMLFNGVLESLAVAKGAIERRELEVKSKQINKAVDIFRALQGSLDAENEPEISDNFHSLYEYCIGRLQECSISLDTSLIDEVVTLFKPIAEAWQQMPEQAKAEGMEKLNAKKQQQASLG